MCGIVGAAARREVSAILIEGLKRLSAHAMTGDLEEGLAMERRVLGGLYRSEIGQTRIREFAERSTTKAKS